MQTLTDRQTVSSRLRQYGDAARARLAPHFSRLGMSYPPKRLRFVGLKNDQRLEIWVTDDTEIWKSLCSYPILAMSGALGPKLREGDRQVPEGVYAIESLNPNSRFHLALRVNYPNDSDRARAELDGRTELGGDIMIHGGAASRGCLAMGDEVAENLFVLVAETGMENVGVILAPIDFRCETLPTELPPLPSWTSELYGEIIEALNALAPTCQEKDSSQ